MGERCGGKPDGSQTSLSFEKREEYAREKKKKKGEENVGMYIIHVYENVLNFSSRDTHLFTASQGSIDDRIRETMHSDASVHARGPTLLEFTRARAYIRVKDLYCKILRHTAKLTYREQFLRIAGKQVT